MRQQYGSPVTIHRRESENQTVGNRAILPPNRHARVVERGAWGRPSAADGAGLSAAEIR